MLFDQIVTCVGEANSTEQNSYKLKIDPFVLLLLSIVFSLIDIVVVVVVDHMMLLQLNRKPIHIRSHNFKNNCVEFIKFEQASLSLSLLQW